LDRILFKEILFSLTRNRLVDRSHKRIKEKETKISCRLLLLIYTETRGLLRIFKGLSNCLIISLQKILADFFIP